MNSLRARLLATTSVVLVAFVVFTGLALERAVRERAELAQQDKLQGLSYALLGSAEITNDGKFQLSTRSLPEATLGRPGSGLYAMVIGAKDKILWRSPSLLGRIPLVNEPAVGETHYANVSNPDGGSLQTLAFGIRWVVDSGKSYRYTLVVAEDSAPFYAQLERFRSVLWAWLSLAAFILLALQLVILRWGLAPLRRLTHALTDIESGEKPRIEGNFPAEIQPLVFNLNAMLASEHQRLKRYRNALGDLAHSLKTPIAVLRGLADDKHLPSEQARQLKDQVGRVNEIVDYQLQRAAAAGKRTLVPPVALRPIAERLIGALGKVYYDAHIGFKISIPRTLSVAVDEGDLTEILGNVLDNACKYGHGQVSISARKRKQWVELWVDDNGPGFPPAERENLLQRGVRADTRREGQGIGLAVVVEIVQAYDGRITLGAGPSNGARIQLRFPAI